MICVIDQIKYDTDKMELVSDKIQHEYKVSFYLIAITLMVKMFVYGEVTKEDGL